MRRRTLILLLVLAAVLTPVAASGDTTPGTGPAETEPPAATPPPTGTTPPPEGAVLIPDGVSIGAVPVGGLTVDAARSAVETTFEVTLGFTYGPTQWSAAPEEFGAVPDIDAALAAAVVAQPGSTVDLPVAFKAKLVRRYVAYLGTLYFKPMRDATVRLVKLRPRISDGHTGLQVLSRVMETAIRHALHTGERGPIELSTHVLKQKVTRASLSGAIIVIHRSSNRLYLYKGEKKWRIFGVATGQAAYPTPLGRFAIAVKQRDPWWYPPPSPWAQGEKPVPPGPGNPLGTRWMGLTAPEVGIHGTPDAASIGYSASHGCIRMHIPDAEWLFDHVKVGTPVFIVAA